MVPLNLLFMRCLKLGAVAYGGPAMIAQIKQMMVGAYISSHIWYSSLADMIVALH